jgi:hypothetical protein
VMVAIWFASVLVSVLNVISTGPRTHPDVLLPPSKNYRAPQRLDSAQLPDRRHYQCCKGVHKRDRNWPQVRKLTPSATFSAFTMGGRKYPTTPASGDLPICASKISKMSESSTSKLESATLF